MDNMDSITPRDWLAGLAMQGMICDSKIIDAFQRISKQDSTGEVTTEKMIAMASYELADAMIKEGAKC